MSARFFEKWFDAESQAALASVCEGLVPGLVVEIGSWEGRSSVVLANALHPRVVHCVDTWAGCASDESGELAKQRDIHTQWTENVAVLTKGNLVAHRMGWREYVPTITEPVALCFIDAEHTYDEVFDNITAVRPLLAPGGVMCGHDADHPPVAAAVCDALGETRTVGSLWVWP